MSTCGWVKGKEEQRKGKGEKDGGRAEGRWGGETTWCVTPRQGERAAGLPLAPLCTSALLQEGF